METFVPKSVIFNAAGKNEILVAGEVDGEIRNAPLVKDADLTARYNELVSTRDAAVKAAQEEFDANKAILDSEAMEKGLEAFVAAQPAEDDAE